MPFEFVKNLKKSKQEPSPPASGPVEPPDDPGSSSQDADGKGKRPAAVAGENLCVDVQGIIIGRGLLADPQMAPEDRIAGNLRPLFISVELRPVVDTRYGL